MEKFRINIGGEIEEVYINFFIDQKIIDKNKIRDIYYITMENGSCNLTYSIHKNYYDRIKIELRNLKIDTILG